MHFLHSNPHPVVQELSIRTSIQQYLRGFTACIGEPLLWGLYAMERMSRYIFGRTECPSRLLNQTLYCKLFDTFVKKPTQFRHPQRPLHQMPWLLDNVTSQCKMLCYLAISELLHCQSIYKL